MLGSPPALLEQRLALGVPALLLGGAYLSEYAFGLYPCEMCWWQRYAHFAALALALLSTVAPPRRLWLASAGLALLAAGGLGAYHAGVEYGWWEGVTACGTVSAAGGDPLEAIMNAPLVRCDQAPWSLFGISLAGWNFLVSTAAGAAVLTLLAARKGPPA